MIKLRYFLSDKQGEKRPSVSVGGKRAKLSGGHTFIMKQMKLMQRYELHLITLKDSSLQENHYSMKNKYHTKTVSPFLLK